MKVILKFEPITVKGGEPSDVLPLQMETTRDHYVLNETFRSMQVMHLVLFSQLKLPFFEASSTEKYNFPWKTLSFKKCLHGKGT